MPFFVSAPFERYHVGWMGDANGLEPVRRLLQVLFPTAIYVGDEPVDAPLGTQNLTDLREVIAA